MCLQFAYDSIQVFPLFFLNKIDKASQSRYLYWFIRIFAEYFELSSIRNVDKS